MITLKNKIIKIFTIICIITLILTLISCKKETRENTETINEQKFITDIT